MPNDTHVPLPNSDRPKPARAKRIGPVDRREKIDVTLALSGPPLPASDRLIGKTLTPEELSAKFGARQADADKVTATLRKYHIHVDDVQLAARSMRVSGTVAAMEAAFRPNLMMMRSPSQGAFRGRIGSLHIPKELAGIVLGVFGLDERKMARRKVARSRASHAKAADKPLGPADLEQHYNFPPGTCAGQKIAIAEFGGGYFAEDTLAYCNRFRRPTPFIQPIAVDAPAYTLEQILALPKKRREEQLDDAGEVMMDVQIIAGLCALAEISVYFSAFDQGGWINLLDRVIADRPAVMSCSWGLAEEDSGWSKGAIDAINDRLNVIRLLGITSCIASGDDGSGDQMNDRQTHVDFPSSSPFALGVGGTMFVTAGKRRKEVTWWEKPGQRAGGGGATGGGVSLHFDRPSWQDVRIQSLNPGSRDGRVTPDVAALAGPPGYDLIFRGRVTEPGEGTSASAPLWAALLVRINGNLPVAKQQRFLTPLLYRKRRGQTLGGIASRDITEGHNTSSPKPGKGYYARKGFDAVTGWGVPDGVKLQKALASV